MQCQGETYLFHMNFLARFSCRVVRTLFLFVVFQLACLNVAPAVLAFDWVPSKEEIQKYRSSWNPFSHGSLLISSQDIQPEGQWYVRPMIFAQIGETSYGNKFTGFWNAKRGPVHLYSVQDPFIQSAFGLTDHVELVAQTSVSSFWARQDGKVTTDTGLGDSSLIVKYRPAVQDPDTWVPPSTGSTRSPSRPANGRARPNRPAASLQSGVFPRPGLEKSA